MNRRSVLTKAGMIAVLLAFVFVNGHLQVVNAQTAQQEEFCAFDLVSFPIMTWYGIRPEHLDLQHFQDLADAGFTINFSHFGDEATNLKALDIAQRAGVKLLISDSRIQPNKPVDTEAMRKIDEVVAAYKDHPALFGYHVRDEPNSSVFGYMAAIKERILSQDSGHLVYGNLFPDYANDEQLGTNTYVEHVDKWMKIFRPQILSYDHYPFTNHGFRDSYYQNMGIIRNAALNAAVPFWAFTMSCEIDPAYPRPNEAWTRLQLFSDLAYGAKGLQYFTYGLPNSGGEVFTIAILDKNGEKTYIYDIAKKVNADIHRLAPVLKTLQSIAVYHSDPVPHGAMGISTPFHVKKAEGAPLLIGYFKCPENKRYVLLVNKDYESAGDVKLTVSKKNRSTDGILQKGRPVSSGDQTRGQCS